MSGSTQTGGAAPAAEETLSFQAEVSRLLHLMVHSVYSEKEIFLRELISNASDACDKLRYLAVTDSKLTDDDSDFRIAINVNAKEGTISIADNGIGMDRQDLIDNLGTIARSGTNAFADALTGDAGKDMALIGQFGVGFYSAFMVASEVKVTSLKAGTSEAHTWTSDGTGNFTVAPTDDKEKLLSGRGTLIELKIRDEDKEYLEAERLRRIIKTYSDHISFPITLTEHKEDGTSDEETVNSASALWTRPKSEITEDQYKEFYHHVGHGFDEPSLTIHYRAEGRHEFTVLLFLPTERPFDLFDPKRSGRVKLYVNRVFITDDAPLLPPYLRFMRGVIDSSDMPLNISREMLQNNPLVRSISNAVTKRVLSELSKMAEKEPEKFTKFWETFGPVLKEGIYEDFERRDQILELTRFRTTKSGDDLKSLKQYVADMQDSQTAIYYITGEDHDAVAKSPQLEGFKARDVEVLLLTDPVDSFWVTSVEGFDGKPFKSATRGASDLEGLKKDGADESSETKDEATSDAALGTLIAAIKQTLGESVKDVRKSDRLTDSAVCLVADEGSLDIHVEKLLKSQNFGGQLPNARILEINPTHPLIKSLAERSQSGMSPDIEDAAHLLHDQAKILEGEPVSDPAAFAKRLQSVMSKAV